MWASISAGGWSSSSGAPARRSGARTRIALFAAALALFAPARAHAEPSDAGVATTVLAPPPEPPPPETTPTLSAPRSLGPFLGRPISRVTVEFAGEPWGETHLPEVRSVRPGDTLTPAVARRALAEVLDTSRFARAEVVASADGSACRLTVKVVARKLIETLQVELGGAKVEREELLHEADFAEGGELVGADLADKQERMETFLARHGYPDATVSLTARVTDDPLRVVVLLEVHPETPRILDRRVFFVYDATPEEVRSATDVYKVKSGDRADETQLDAADNLLETRLHTSGWHKAEVSHDVVKHGTEVFLRVRVVTGKRYEARFEGNDHYDETALTGALASETDSDFTPAHLTDKVRDFYRKHGFLDAEVTFEERGTAKDRVHYLVFHVLEHRRVTVVARSYPCLKEYEIAHLNEGGPTSASQIGSEIDSYLEEELPGADLLKSPDPRGAEALLGPGGDTPRGARAVPIDLDPDGTYVADTYDRALAHVQELYRNEGFLHAEVGPAELLRRRCKARSPAGQCIPEPFVAPPPSTCAYDATNLPLPSQPLDPGYTCVPDPAHGVTCEASIALRVPVRLGPRTSVYDVGFSGTHALAPSRLLAAAQLKMGDPANAVKIEEARRKLLDLYKEEGYAFADIKYTIEESLDHTRARIHFDVAEGEQVIVRQIVIQGNDLTLDSVIRRRIALEVGRPYRASLVRKTQERIATLNVFSSVNVGLSDPEVPAKNKTVVITVSEVLPKYVEIRPGFSTGEGIRLTNEFGDRNLYGTAIGLSTRLQISYLPDAFILDPQVRDNFRTLTDLERIAGRITVRGDFPEIGLGPLVRMGVDGVLARTLNRDFVLLKAAAIPSFIYRPMRELQFTVSPTVERNSVKVFQKLSLDDFLRELQASGASRDIATLLRVPDGDSNAYSQRLIVTWDRRDNSFNAHTGTYFVSGVEHVDWYPASTIVNSSTFDSGDATENFEGHFLRLTETFVGYIPITKKITLAAGVRVGTNVQVTPNSHTYPDRLFFLGGVDSMRGWLQDSFIPQDYVDRIQADSGKPDNDPNNPKFTANSIAVRGGNLMVNPKLELRIPVKGPFETALFTDVGNLWVDPLYPFTHGFPVRASVGSGIRYQTPIGPLAFDYGINLTRHTAYEDFGAFHFAIGLF